ncbi:MAG: 4Fe-4S dicluster domain-containing protein [Firmicutes bacterium]|nr:4Fe-4S dicluster domain-containing protein [Bacillota bacterium]
MINKTVVNYTLESCVRCMRCVQTCPTSALSMHDNRVTVNESKCLNCGKCIRACHSKGLLAKGSSLDAIKDYDFTVCLVPSAMIMQCGGLEEAEELFYAIKQLGFDVVEDITGTEGQLMEETRRLAENGENDTVIASTCPVINRLIETSYPMLLEHLLPLNYPSEVAAKQARKIYKDKGNVGIFYCSECEAKLMLAKHPYGNTQYEVDHALASVDLLPLINENMGKGRLPVTLCREGLQATSPTLMLQKQTDLIADGFDKINDVLDMEEFGIFDSFRLIHLFPCFNGCVGGHLLWGNSYIVKHNMDALTSQRSKPPADYPIEDFYTDEFNSADEGSVSFMEKMAFFQKVNEQLEHLPGYDCSACGMQTCRIMAEEIVKGHKSLDDCHILHSMRGRKKE